MTAKNFFPQPGHAFSIVSSCFCSFAISIPDSYGVKCKSPATPIRVAGRNFRLSPQKATMIRIAQSRLCVNRFSPNRRLLIVFVESYICHKQTRRHFFRQFILTLFPAPTRFFSHVLNRNIVFSDSFVDDIRKNFGYYSDFVLHISCGNPSVQGNSLAIRYSRWWTWYFPLWH